MHDVLALLCRGNTLTLMYQEYIKTMDFELDYFNICPISYGRDPLCNKIQRLKIILKVSIDLVRKYHY